MSNVIVPESLVDDWRKLLEDKLHAFEREVKKAKTELAFVEVALEDGYSGMRWIRDCLVDLEEQVNGS